MRRAPGMLVAALLLLAGGCGPQRRPEAFPGAPPGTTATSPEERPVPTPADATDRLTLELTYYWVATAEPGDPAGPLVPLLDAEGEAIAEVSEILARRIALEGTGRLPDGRLVNVANDQPWPDVRFMLLDQTRAPFGLDARGEPLVPFRSVAVDPGVVVLGSTLYSPALDGRRLPDGTTHDGCLVAADTGLGIRGLHLDLFTGTREHYVELDHALGERTTLEVLVGSSRCESPGAEDR